MFFLLSICFLFQENFNLTKYQKKNICSLENIIEAEAKKNKIEPELLASVIFVESGFYPKVVSTAGACGLTQVIPKYTGGPETKNIKYTCNQLKDPRTSIKVGAKILAYVTRNYANKNTKKGLCFYNAGNICLKKKGLYKRSRYVKKVMEIYHTINNNR